MSPPPDFWSDFWPGVWQDFWPGCLGGISHKYSVRSYPAWGKHLSNSKKNISISLKPPPFFLLCILGRTLLTGWGPQKHFPFFRQCKRSVRGSGAEDIAQASFFLKAVLVISTDHLRWLRQFSSFACFSMFFSCFSFFWLFSSFSFFSFILFLISTDL